MRKVGIREVSGEVISNSSNTGEIVGVTKSGVLLGVLLPLTKRVLERLAGNDARNMAARVAEAEADLADGTPPIDLNELLEESAGAGRKTDFERVGIRDFTGVRLERAAADNRPLVVVNGRVAVALYLPVMNTWVERLVEDSVERFLGARAPQPVSQPVSQRLTEPARGRLGRSGWLFEHQRVIGIRIVGDSPDNRQALIGVVTNMLAEVVAGPIEVPLTSLDKRDVFAEILKLADALNAGLIEGEQELAGVGLEIGGHVHNGRVVHSSNINWDDFPLAERLASNLGVPVVLENDADALALHECNFEGIDYEDFAIILLTELGVGCGLVLDGRVYRGARGMAGELGHVPIETNDPEVIKCRCGNPGCLEGVATQRAIEWELNHQEYPGDFASALQDGENQLVRKVFGNAGASLGRSIATILNLLNPSALVIYGPVELVGGARTFHINEHVGNVGLTGVYIGAMLEAIRRHAFSNSAGHCQFFVRRRAPELGAKAAAACMIDILEPSMTRRTQAVPAWSR